MIFKAIAEVELYQKYVDIIEADNLDNALEILKRDVKWIFGKSIIGIREIKPIYCPCPECGMEQQNFVGCMNLDCPSRKKEK